MDTGENMLSGAIGGLAGGLLMTAFMTMGKKTGLIEQPLPEKFERKFEDLVGVQERPGPAQELLLSQAEHLLFSAALGAGYGLLRGAFDLPAIPSGPLYGLSIYALMLGGIGPALDVTRGPWREQPTTVGRRVMMHVAYGTVTALVAERVRRAAHSSEKPVVSDWAHGPA